MEYTSLGLKVQSMLIIRQRQWQTEDTRSPTEKAMILGGLYMSMRSKNTLQSRVKSGRFVVSEVDLVQKQMGPACGT